MHWVGRLLVQQVAWSAGMRPLQGCRSAPAAAAVCLCHADMLIWRKKHAYSCHVAGMYTSWLPTSNSVYPKVCKSTQGEGGGCLRSNMLPGGCVS
jgi:hypothetical protein